MMFRKSFKLFTAGVMMAAALAASGSMGVMAAQNTTEAGAKEIALNDAGLAENDVIFERVELGTERGASVYEIEFKTAAVEYDYDIAVSDGEIVKESRELRLPSANGSQISEEQAKQKAVEDAKADESSVTFTLVRNETEDGIPVFEIKFEDDANEYEYDIAKAGGKILNASRTVKIPACVAAEEKAKASASTGKTGREAAIDAALRHAGFTADEVYALRCEKDYDDGREIYEVDFRKDGYEYSYDIDARDYSVLEWDMDYDD